MVSVRTRMAAYQNLTDLHCPTPVVRVGVWDPAGDPDAAQAIGSQPWPQRLGKICGDGLGARDARQRRVAGSSVGSGQNVADRCREDGFRERVRLVDSASSPFTGGGLAGVDAALTATRSGGTSLGFAAGSARFRSGLLRAAKPPRMSGVCPRCCCLVGIAGYG